MKDPFEVRDLEDRRREKKKGGGVCGKKIENIIPSWQSWVSKGSFMKHKCDQGKGLLDLMKAVQEALIGISGVAALWGEIEERNSEEVRQ